VKGPFLTVIGVAALILYLLGFNELALLFGGGILVMLVRNLGRLGRGDGAATALLPLGSISSLFFAQAAPVSLGQLFGAS
jgi:chromate transporter